MTQARSMKLSPALAEAADALTRHLGYPSRNAMLKGLIRSACIHGGHPKAVHWSRLPLWQQDTLDEGCRTTVKKALEQRDTARVPA
jgi:hypothetical protein